MNAKPWETHEAAEAEVASWWPPGRIEALPPTARGSPRRQWPGLSGLILLEFRFAAGRSTERGYLREIEKTDEVARRLSPTVLTLNRAAKTLEAFDGFVPAAIGDASGADAAAAGNELRKALRAYLDAAQRLASARARLKEIGLGKREAAGSEGWRGDAAARVARLAPDVARSPTKLAIVEIAARLSPPVATEEEFRDVRVARWKRAAKLTVKGTRAARKRPRSRARG